MLEEVRTETGELKHGIYLRKPWKSRWIIDILESNILNQIEFTGYEAPLGLTYSSAVDGLHGVRE